MHICGLNASAIESLWLRDTNVEIDGDFGGDTYSAMVPADEENYSKGGSCILFYSKHLCAVNWKDLFVDGLEAIWPQVKFPSCSVFQ